VLAVGALRFAFATSSASFPKLTAIACDWFRCSTYILSLKAAFLRLDLVVIFSTEMYVS
jgi:hypothetical protein